MDDADDVSGSPKSITEGDYRGCLEVHLSDVYKSQVVEFLDAIRSEYVRSFDAYACVAPHNTECLTIIATGEAFGMLRLGTNYDAPSVRLEALE